MSLRLSGQTYDGGAGFSFDDLRALLAQIESPWRAWARETGRRCRIRLADDADWISQFAVVVVDQSVDVYTNVFMTRRTRDLLGEAFGAPLIGDEELATIAAYHAHLARLARTREDI